MAKQTSCLCNAIAELSQNMVFHAAEPIKPGEGVGAQVRNSSERLGLDYGVVWRAWRGRSGPKVFPEIQEAWLRFVARRKAENSEAIAEAARSFARLEEEVGRAIHTSASADEGPTGPRLVRRPA